MLRLLHIIVAAVLVLAAADVYRIKFASTRQAEQVAKVRAEIRRERDAIAALRAQWTELDRPERIEQLARRHLPLKPIDIHQFDHLDHLPDRRIEIVPPGTRDPIGAIIESYAEEEGALTGSIPSDRR
jgi:cell division protein FtsL